MTLLHLTKLKVNENFRYNYNETNCRYNTDILQIAPYNYSKNWLFYLTTLQKVLKNVGSKRRNISF